MTALTISFTDARFTHPRIRDRFDLLLGVEATLSLAVNDRLIYTEPMFPIVELRSAIAQWGPEMGDFEFESMESDERDLIWIRRQSSGRWRAGSALQDDIAIDELADGEVVLGCRAFIDDVNAWVRDNLGVEIDDVVGR